MAAPPREKFRNFLPPLRLLNNFDRLLQFFLRPLQRGRPSGRIGGHTLGPHITTRERFQRLAHVPDMIEHFGRCLHAFVGRHSRLPLHLHKHNHPTAFLCSRPKNRRAGQSKWVQRAPRAHLWTIELRRTAATSTTRDESRLVSLRRSRASKTALTSAARAGKPKHLIGHQASGHIVRQTVTSLHE